MKNLLISAILMFLITSCSTTTKFPVSSVTPAAVISAEVKQDKSNNYIISVTANYLASAERLSPPRKTYVVWIATRDNGIKNIGQLKGKNEKTATLETLTSFDPMEIIVTAEDEGDVSYPAGIEISRAAIKK
jgi:DNA mismatch repair ATPase MutS